MKYPNKLKEYRLAKRLTLHQVAILMGMHCEDRLSHWERGTALPNIKNALRLASVYNVSINDLYDSLSLDP
jgi:transcriptional regulator with XRE-family HTH domain